MTDESVMISAEILDSGINVSSADPLIGTLELISSKDGVIEVTMNRRNAENLIGILVEFLALGQGSDAPKNTSNRPPCSEFELVAGAEIEPGSSGL